jgi:glycogen operon protein
VGQFPVLWTEWNGKYRDAVRAFWRDRGCALGEFATRLTGSSDLYEHGGRGPHASINFVTCHDGFTLRDLVSYEQKRNEANGENNRDGEKDNRSWNCGVEGPTDDPEIDALRRRQMRNLAATLLLSLGVPMISGGDELSRTQRGNNNAYCQDNEISWYDWKLDADGRRFLEFVRRVIAIRRDQPVFRRRSFLDGRAPDDVTGTKDAYWLEPDDSEMPQEGWDESGRGELGLLLTAGAIDEVDRVGRSIAGEDMLLFINGGDRDVAFRLSRRAPVLRWERLLDTWIEDITRERRRFWKRGQSYRVRARSLVLFRGVPRPPRGEGRA